MASAWGLSWGFSWGNSWGPVGLDEKAPDGGGSGGIGKKKRKKKRVYDDVTLKPDDANYRPLMGPVAEFERLNQLKALRASYIESLNAREMTKEEFADKTKAVDNQIALILLLTIH